MNTKQKSPVLGAILNNILWGGGHFYAGNNKRGWFVLVLSTIFFLPLIIMTGLFGWLPVVVVMMADGWIAVNRANGHSDSHGMGALIMLVLSGLICLALIGGIGIAILLVIV